MLSSLLSPGSVGETLNLLCSAFHRCVCEHVKYPPTPLAPMTPTRNPNVTLSVTSCHASHCQARCTHTQALLGEQQKARKAQCRSQSVFLCVWWSCFIWFFLLTVHWAGYLAGLQFPGRAAPLSTLDSGALGSP